MPYKNPHYHRDYLREHNAERRAYLRARYQADPTKQAVASKRYRAKHADKVRARNNSPQYIAKRNEWRVQNPERCALYARRGRLRKYGVTPEWWDQQAESQGQACAICRTSFIGMKPQAINVDHCHRTGMLRALLCNKCNTGLGAFMEDSQIFAAALHYLASFPVTPPAP